MACITCPLEGFLQWIRTASADNIIKMPSSQMVPCVSTHLAPMTTIVHKRKQTQGGGVTCPMSHSQYSSRTRVCLHNMALNHSLLLRGAVYCALPPYSLKLPLSSLGLLVPAPWLVGYFCNDASRVPAVSTSLFFPTHTSFPDPPQHVGLPHPHT